MKTITSLCVAFFAFLFLAVKSMGSKMLQILLILRKLNNSLKLFQ